MVRIKISSKEQIQKINSLSIKLQILSFQATQFFQEKVIPYPFFH